MKTISRNFKAGISIMLAAFIFTIVVPGFPSKARAGAGAFLGGMVAGHLITGAVQRDKVRTAAAVESASQPKTQTVYVQQAPAATTSSQPAQTAKPSVEKRLKELDKLAKDGYITPEEYKARKKAIIDSI